MSEAGKQAEESVPTPHPQCRALFPVSLCRNTHSPVATELTGTISWPRRSSLAGGSGSHPRALQPGDPLSCPFLPETPMALA